MDKLLQLRSAHQWITILQNTIDFIVSETPPDTFQERAEDVQEILIVLKQLRSAFSQNAESNGQIR